MSAQLSRRRFLHGAAAAFPLTLAASGPAMAHAKHSPARALRLAFLTDVHVQPERHAARGLAQCLHHVQELDDPPELIINGGDAIMDSLGTGAERTDLQWKLWQSALANECSLPVKHCLGNHDVWGWDRSASGTSGDETQWGKRRALDECGLEKPYYSFDHSGWHFITLDSIHPDPDVVYRGQLDDAQFDWLARDLQNTPSETPIAIVSHIPIISATNFEFAEELKADPRRIVSVSHNHNDARRIVELLRQHKNIRLALSGHMHLTERIDYAGITFLCNGAVSGYWWKGDHLHTDEGYAVIDLFADGSFAHQYVGYGWQVDR